MDVSIGVIRKQSVPAAAPLGTVAAAEAFASRIASCYLPARFSASRAELALAYEPAPQVNYFQSAQVDVAPSVTIHDHHAFAAVPRQTAVANGEAQGFGEAQAAALFERLFSRHKRTASFAEKGMPVEPAPAGSPGTQPIPSFPVDLSRAVERILPRPATADRPSARAKEPRLFDGGNSDAGWGTRAILPATPKPFTLAEPEVKRVADQVMREIDHRVIARRERMGKR